MRIGITGATGLVGSRLAALLAHHDVVPLGGAQDIDFREGAEAWETRIPAVDAIIHAAAKTNVDEVERERHLGSKGEAWKVNFEAAAALARLAQRRKTRFVLLSTDFVFPANARGPFPEKPTPVCRPEEVSWYGWTKASAEQAAQRADGSILRISYPFRANFPRKQDLVRRVLRAAEQGDSIQLFVDQWITPTFIDDAAASVEAILRRPAGEVFHCASSDRLTPHQLGSLAAQLAGRHLDGVATKFANASGRAPRPQFGGLMTDASKAKGLKIRSVRECLEDLMGQRGQEQKAP